MEVKMHYLMFCSKNLNFLHTVLVSKLRHAQKVGSGPMGLRVEKNASTISKARGPPDQVLALIFFRN